MNDHLLGDALPPLASHGTGHLPHLLFDLDGTLTNPFDGITRSLQHALCELGMLGHSQEALRECIGPPLRSTFSRLLGTSEPSVIERAVAVYRARYFETGLYENECYDGVKDVLEELSRAGHRMFIVTSKITEAAVAIARHFAFDAYFDAIHGSDLKGTLDDKANLVAYVLTAQSLLPADCVMIGDRMHDIVAAKSNHVATLGVTWGFGSRDELLDAGADLLCDDPRDLPAFVATMTTSRTAN